ncbi:hypothetical protein Rsw2DRAFT_0763 [Rhodobacter ferrooxidans]|uniref:Uncharacterized protein n=2 Tax=Rhodobacter ferrooxidans TaxID=371731 RepID=C8RY85_9RHOB|nr:hypothetical protein Rsw2DRAFT_0763 [Rhodobacter sp. SW2]
MAATPALACSPMPVVASATPMRGEGCAIAYNLSEYRTVGLGSIRDLGHGFLSQVAFDGTACGAEENLVVLDCNAGLAAVAGPTRWSLMDLEGTKTAAALLEDQVAAAVQAGDGSLDAVAALATKAGMPDLLRIKADAAINLNGQKLPLRCGCTTYYPDLKPAG